MKTKWIVWTLVLLLTGVRGALAIRHGLGAEEAYWWLLGMRWEWASISGPGGTAWLAGTLDALGGPTALRLAGPAFALLASLGLWILLRPFAGSTATAWAVAVFNLLPWINSLSLVFGPELPALTAWIWLVAALVRWHSKPAGMVWWVVAGVVWGLGLLLSYWLLAAAVALPFLLRRGHHFSFSALAGVVWILFCGLAALAGPLAWQVGTDWIALSRQTWVSLRAFGGESSLSALLNWAAGFGWLGALALLAAAGGTLVHHSRSPAFQACRWLTAPFFVLGIWALWNGRDLPLLQLAWAVPALAASAIWLGRNENERCLRRWSGVGIGLACLVAGVSSLALLASSAGVRQEPPWRDLAARMQRALSIHQAAGASPLFLIADRGESAAAIAYYLLQNREAGLVPAHFPPVFVRESQNAASQFALWPRYDEFVPSEHAPNPHFAEHQATNPYLGHSAIYLGPEAPEVLPQVISNGFERVIPLEILHTGAGDFHLYLCEDYQTAPL